MKIWGFIKDMINKGAVNEIFVHVRNVTAATLIVAAGVYSHAHSGGIHLISVLPSKYVGDIIAGVGIALLLLNLLDGVSKMSKLRYNIILIIFMIVFYLLFIVRLVEILLSFRMHLR